MRLSRPSAPARATFAIAMLAFAACREEPLPPLAPGADVVLVIVDTLRADGLSSYGNPRRTSPGLDALAARGVKFEECLAQAPNTATSHASLFTALPPWTHRVANLTNAETGTAGLPPAFMTLAERFAAAGYQTAAFTDGGPLGTAWNLMQGFEVHEGRYEGVAAKVDRAREFLDDERDDRPLFLLVHTYQVHQPFAPPEEYVARFDPEYEGVLSERVAEVRQGRAAGSESEPNGKILMRGRSEFTERDFEHLRALYDAEVAYTDEEFSRLWERLDEEGGRDRTVIAVTSDHGEEFGEHGNWGHVQLHRETLHVPLILAGPGIAPGVVSDRVSLLDLGPTLLDVVGLRAGPGLGEDGAAAGIGRSLRPALDGVPVDRPSFATTTEHLYLGDPRYPKRRSVRVGTGADARALLVEQRHGPEVTEVYLLGDDPGEARPFRAGSAEFAEAAELARALAEQVKAAAEIRNFLLFGASSQLIFRPGSDELEELRRLGYVGDDEEEPRAVGDKSPSAD